jgi:hypothetical protein
VSPLLPNGPQLQAGGTSSWLGRVRRLATQPIGASRPAGRVSVALFPDRMVVARVEGRLSPRITQCETVPVAAAPSAGAPRWRPALEALAAKLRTGVLAAGEVTVILSNHFVHYVIVPYTDVLGDEDEQIAFARHRFAGIFGNQADAWTVRLSPAYPGEARLACAAENSFVAALEELMAPLGKRYVSLQPHLMASFNRAHSRLGAHASWFVVAEPGLLCVALIEGGQWKSVHGVKVGRDWAAELPAVLAREECLVESDVECRKVLVLAADVPAPAFAASGKWQIERLLPKRPPGLAGEFSIAMGV